MRIRTIIVAMLALVFAAACGAPQRLTHHRSALLYPELKPFVPEGRIAHIPADMRGGAAAEVRSTKDEDDAAGGDSSGSAVTPSSPEDDPPPVIVSDSDGSQVARAAAAKVGAASVNAPGQRFNEDCSGFTRAIYSANGVDLFADGVRPGENGVTAIYRFVSRRGGLHDDEPLPGELVFFRNTADYNRDGRENDGLTHIGIVESVEPSGTVHVIHRNSRGIVRENMTLDMPLVHKDRTGAVLNHWLRGQPNPKLMSELFVTYGKVLAAPKTSPLTEAINKTASDGDSENSGGSSSEN